MFSSRIPVLLYTHLQHAVQAYCFVLFCFFFFGGGGSCLFMFVGGRLGRVNIVTLRVGARAKERKGGEGGEKKIRRL